MMNLPDQLHTTNPEIASALRNHPSKLFVETTTRCNLGCAMCVKQSSGCEMQEMDMSPETFAALAGSFTQLEALILNGIGEPLLNPHLESFIRMAKETLPCGSWVGFQTNGLLMTNLRAIALVDAGLDRICISIDAASPEMFHELREGGDLSDIERAIAAVRNAKRICDRPDVAVGIEYVVMRKNMQELPAALRWAAGHGASFAIVSHVLPYEEQHAGEAAYNLVSDEVIELFGRYSRKALEQGLDMANYFQSRWKYSRSPDEQRLLDLVEAMRAEANHRGFFLDMKKLLALDKGQIGELKQVFEQAGQVALECGIELRLPEINVSGKRHCSFVEDGGVFVSAEGNISPCYFLWHRYSCFASGWSQQVAPRIFGNVHEQDLMHIWNSEEYRAFRSQVISYDYPGCTSCALAPCDYVQTEKFEQDCHIGTVPCGSCLWCTGIFQCLR